MSKKKSGKSASAKPTVAKRAREFMDRIADREARVGIVGMGYVGLPLAMAFCRQGFHVLGFDVDPDKVKQLNKGKSYIGHIKSSELKPSVDAGLLEATSDFARAGEPDALLICVPTPLTDHREPDMRYIRVTTEQLAPVLRPGQLVVLESTTYPGTTDEVMRPRLEADGLCAGQDFFLAYSPEREDPGNPKFETSRIPKVVGGHDRHSLQVARALYDCIVPATHPVSSTAAAEAVKLLENIFRSINIALVNELKVIYDRMGIDVWEVIEAASSKPFGYMPFYPGPGLGGHCIPIDPFYLTWKAREYGVATRFIELAGEINVSMPGYVIDRLIEALNERGQALKGSKILLLGMAYKPNVDDDRESPAYTLFDLLLARGAKVDYHDPHIPRIRPSRRYGHLTGRRSVKLTDARLAGYDAVVIVTDHDAVDYEQVVAQAPLVVDTRNATRGVKRGRQKIVRA
jgi:UDP-N-acetyl-D-glucosamine dehydrogenase